jgi:hypothetical protein
MRTKNDDDPPIAHGPSIAAVALWGASGGRRAQLLTDEERAQLSVIASLARFKKGAQIYREGERADAVFNVVSGVVKSYKVLPDKTERIAAFLFADDLFGLAEERELHQRDEGRDRCYGLPDTGVRSGKPA